MTGPVSFAPEDLTEDGFLGGRLRILQPRSGYRAATDPVLLAAAVPAMAGQSVLELGCGAGVASLCLGARVPGLALCGVELQPAYADLARRNAVLNGITLDVVDGNVRTLPAEIRARRFDHVMLNPPYYPARGGTAARDFGRETALREDLPLAEWIGAGLRRLKPGGWMTVIQAAGRLPEVLAGMSGSVTVLPVASRAGRAVHRVIVRVRKGGKAAFVLLSPIVMHDGAAHAGDQDSYSDLARSVLRFGGILRFDA